MLMDEMKLIFIWNVKHVPKLEGRGLSRSK